MSKEKCDKYDVRCVFWDYDGCLILYQAMCPYEKACDDDFNDFNRPLRDKKDLRNGEKGNQNSLQRRR